MFNKLTVIILLIILIILSLGIIFLTKQTYKPTPPEAVQMFSPTPKISSRPELTREEVLKNQSEADKNYASWQQDVVTNYPWYTKLPIERNDYYVYFNLNKKEFIARLYINSKSQIPIDQQITSFKDSVLNDLITIGVDTNSYKINWENVNSQ